MTKSAVFARVRTPKRHRRSHTVTRKYGQPGNLHTIKLEYDDNGIVREVYTSDGKPHIQDVKATASHFGLRWPLGHPLCSVIVARR